MTVYDLHRGSEAFVEMPDLPLSVALGSFDGLHMGHTELIRQAKCSADKSCVFTFRQNPFGTPYIITLEQKLNLLTEMGVDYVCVSDFEEVSDMDWQEFVEDVLIAGLGATHAVCGFNFRFGRDAQGTASHLFRMMQNRGRGCSICDAVHYDGMPVSSTRIRALLAQGDIEAANLLLTRPYTLDCHVVHGNGIGSGFGFPTVNCAYDPARTPIATGVYITECMGHPSVTNFGTRPTVTDKNEPVYETFIIGYTGDLYGQNISVRFHKRLRDEMKFSCVRELTEQISHDAACAVEYFKK